MKKIAAVALTSVALAAGVAEMDAASGASPRTCFSAADWGPVSDAVRPCVQITKIAEDGSFTYRVSDADGTNRYTAGVGALDR
jgi:hypothetical protein